MDTQKSFSFNWGSQQSHILDGLKTLAVGELNSVFLTDVTLACEGHYIEAHRLVLSLCSSFFKELFSQNERISDKAHGIVILSHVSAKDLRYMLQFMYQGAVQVPQKDVDSFLESGRLLKVEGLEGTGRVGVGISDSTPRTSVPPHSKPCPRSAKRKKRRRSSASKHSCASSDEEVVTDKKKACPTTATNPQPPPNIKLESNESAPHYSSFQDVDDHDNDNDDEGGMMLDDFGDAGDSDIGGGVVEFCSEIETATSSTPAPASCLAGQRTIISVKRRPGRPRLDGSIAPPPKYESDSSSSSGDDDSSDYDSSSTVDYIDAPPSKKRMRRPRIQHSWILLKTFTTFEEAKADLQVKKQYSMRRKQPLSNGVKHFYECREGKDCLVKACVFERNDMETNVVELYKNDREHNHDGCEKQGLTVETKNRIHQLWASGVRKPKAIMQVLKKEGKDPKLSQLASYIQYNIRSKINSLSMNKA
ncbi:unnamed protein product [Orchesella dallaii]|uniref:BTB domain-containing protein n=1 Tax=Orchesella dallaii TaxID=48710 RepID=A0ABP1QR85_9HEXA